MNKLQLYITKSGNTFKSVFNLNPSEDVRTHVVDVADAVGQIEYDVEEKNIFYMVSSTAEGMFVTIIRTIPPLKGHHLAAWIYIPAGLQIGGEELERVVRVTTRKVSATEVTADDVADLREVFNTEYASDPAAPALTANRGVQYAWRTYGVPGLPTLTRLLGEGRYQQAYLPFAAVVFIDGELGIDMTAANLDDVPVGDWATILPPEPTDEGFEAHVFGRLLDRPLLGTLGADLTVTWSRPGFEDVERTVVIDSKEFTPEPVSTNDSHKTLTPASFYITSQATRQPLTECTIRVNGREITPAGQSFTHDELSRASVLISCDGHFAFTGHIDLASTTRALVQLQEKRKVYRFELPVISSEYGGPVRFEIKTKKAMNESPIEGYNLLDDLQEGATRTNHLGYVSANKSQTSMLLSGLVGLVIGVLFMLLFGQCSATPGESTLAPAANPDSIVAEDVPDVDQTPTVVPTATAMPNPEPADAQPAAAPAASATLAKAIKYLDNNKTWSRDSMEKYPDLRGLYDDLNNFSTSRVTGAWADKLKDSKTMQKVVQHADWGSKKKRKDDRSTYNKGDDKNIVVQSYLNFVDP